MATDIFSVLCPPGPWQMEVAWRRAMSEAQALQQILDRMNSEAKASEPHRPLRKGRCRSIKSQVPCKRMGRFDGYCYQHINEGS